jgi:hypothetical protein
MHLIIHPSTPGSSKWSLSLRFPHKNPIFTCAKQRTKSRNRISYVCDTPSSDSFRSSRCYLLWWKGITPSVTQALMFKHYIYSLTQTWPKQ